MNNMSKLLASTIVLAALGTEAMDIGDLPRQLEDVANPGIQFEAAQTAVNHPDLAARAGLAPHQLEQAARIVLENGPMVGLGVQIAAADILMRNPAALDPATRQRIADIRGMPLFVVFPDELPRQLEDVANPGIQFEAAQTAVNHPDLAARAGLAPHQLEQAARIVLENGPMVGLGVQNAAADILMRNPAALDPATRQRIADVRGVTIEALFGGAGK